MKHRVSDVQPAAVAAALCTTWPKSRDLQCNRRTSFLVGCVCTGECDSPSLLLPPPPPPDSSMHNACGPSNNLPPCHYQKLISARCLPAVLPGEPGHPWGAENASDTTAACRKCHNWSHNPNKYLFNSGPKALRIYAFNASIPPPSIS